MKKLLLLLFLLPVFCRAQTRLKEYKASNFVTYHDRDTLILASGTAPETGNFRFVEIGGIGRSADPIKNQIGQQFNNTNLIIKKIYETNIRGAKKIMFVTSGFGGISMTNFYVYIEDAIQNCEVKPCNKEGTISKQIGSVADELLKLKQLLDAGAITQAEYDAQKKKLLN